MRKFLIDIQYILAINPTAGSFKIFEYCQRNFAIFSVSMLSKSDLIAIFSCFSVDTQKFLKQICKNLIEKLLRGLQCLIDCLDIRLSTLTKTSLSVAVLQKVLEVIIVKVEEKNLRTNNLIEELKMQQEDAKVQQDTALVEAEKVNTESSKAIKIKLEA